MRILCVGNMLEHICVNITYRPILSTKAPLHNIHNLSFCQRDAKFWPKVTSLVHFWILKNVQKDSWNIIHFHILCGCNFMEHISKNKLISQIVMFPWWFFKYKGARFYVLSTHLCGSYYCVWTCLVLGSLKK